MLERMTRYARREMARGERLSWITRHMLGLYAGLPGAKEFRRQLSEGARDPAGARRICCLPRAKPASDSAKRRHKVQTGAIADIRRWWCLSCARKRADCRATYPGAHALKDILPMIPGELISEYRTRLALEQVQADDRRRARAVRADRNDQCARRSNPRLGTNAWAQLCRAASEHPVLNSVAAATRLTLEQVHAEQRRRLMPVSAQAIVPTRAVL